MLFFRIFFLLLSLIVDINIWLGSLNEDNWTFFSCLEQFCTHSIIQEASPFLKDWIGSIRYLSLNVWVVKAQRWGYCCSERGYHDWESKSTSPWWKLQTSHLFKWEVEIMDVKIIHIWIQSFLEMWVIQDTDVADQCGISSTSSASTSDILSIPNLEAAISFRLCCLNSQNTPPPLWHLTSLATSTRLGGTIWAALAWAQNVVFSSSALIYLTYYKKRVRQKPKHRINEKMDKAKSRTKLNENMLEAAKDPWLGWGLA